MRGIDKLENRMATQLSYFFLSTLGTAMNEIYAVDANFVKDRPYKVTRNKAKRKIADISPEEAYIPNRRGNNLRFKFSYGFYIVPDLENLKKLHLKLFLQDNTSKEVLFIENLIHLTKLHLLEDEYLVIKI